MITQDGENVAGNDNPSLQEGEPVAQLDESSAQNTNFAPLLTAESPQIFSNTVSVEIPKVYELVTIAIAIADLEEFFPEDVPSDMFTDKSTPYYQEIEAHFGQFRNHPLIEYIRTAYAPRIEERAGNDELLAYRIESLTYQFDEQDELVLNDAYKTPSQLEEIVGIELPPLPFSLEDPDTRALLTDFARETDFHQFYADRQDEYNRLTQLSDDLCHFEAALNWLTKQFPVAYDNHRFILSPLIGSTHNVVHLNTVDGTFTQSVMYVPTFRGDGESAAEVSVNDQAAHCRTSFTEIDHGYVDPTTGHYSEAVEQAMPDITFWNTKGFAQAAYNTSYSTFNEYMTWSVYSLYIITGSSGGGDSIPGRNNGRPPRVRTIP